MEEKDGAALQPRQIRRVVERREGAGAEIHRDQNRSDGEH
jgi:hypothetical protein